MPTNRNYINIFTGQYSNAINKKVIRKATDFLLYSNIFIAFCAVALAFTIQLIVAGSTSLNNNCLFIFFATLFTYSYLKLSSTAGSVYTTAHRAWAKQYPQLSRNIMLIAFIAAAGLFFGLSSPVKWIVVILGIVTFFYGFVAVPFTHPQIKLRDLGLLKTVFVSMVWSVATVLLPIVDYGLPAQVVALILLRRFLFILALIMMFEIKDMPGDLFNKLKTIPVAIGVKRTKLLSQFILLIMLITTIGQYFLFNLQFSIMLGLNASFLLSIICIQYVEESAPNYLYYLVIDGMMLAQFIFVYAAVNLF